MNWPFTSHRTDPDLTRRKEETERQLVSEQMRLNQTIQVIESGSRVMKNMAGMMTLLKLAQDIKR